MNNINKLEPLKDLLGTMKLINAITTVTGGAN